MRNVLLLCRTDWFRLAGLPRYSLVYLLILAGFSVSTHVAPIDLTAIDADNDQQAQLEAVREFIRQRMDVIDHRAGGQAPFARHQRRAPAPALPRGHHLPRVVTPRHKPPSP